jgi:hypothetical protein
MVKDLQREKSMEKRNEALWSVVLETVEEFGKSSDDFMTAAALIERWLKYKRPEDLKKANELAEIDGLGGDYLTPALYFKYKRYLSEKAQENLLDDLRISVAPGNWLRVTKQGYGNVNIPQKGTQNNILAGEALGKVGMYKDAFEYGKKLLRDLLDVTNDAGMVPEYNSPVYTGVSIAPLATIANYAEDKEAVLMARLAQEIIFLDLCSRYHEPTNQMSGPYSRNYMPTRAGGAGGTMKLLYKLLPQGLYSSFKPSYQWFRKSPEIQWASTGSREAGWIASLDRYSYPDFMNVLAVEKQFPYEVYATGKCGPGTWSNDTDAGGRYDTSCYMTKEYSLASASRGYGNHGQSHGVVLWWRKNSPVQSMKDFKTMMWMYIEDERRMDELNSYPGIESKYWHLDEGRYHTVQNKNKVIALYQPKKLGTEHSKLRLNCYIPIYDEIDELWVGEKKVEKFPQYFSYSDIVFIRDANTYIAVRFLPATKLGVEHEVVFDIIEEVSNPKMIVISSYNYDGPKRTFTAEETDNTRNGFVMEVAEANDYDSFESFKKHVKASQIEEALYANGVWAVRYTNGKENLSIAYHLTAHEIIERRINGKDVVIPMFSSPLVKEDRNGYIEIARTSLNTRFGLPIWLMADEKRSTYMVMNPNSQNTPVDLKTPDGELKIDALPLARIIYKPRSKKTLEILSAPELGIIQFSAKTKQPKIIVNDTPLSMNNVKSQGHGTWTATTKTNW